MDKAAISTIAQRLASAKRVLFVTGAGISAESGLPTYRGIGGLYKDGATEDGIPIEEALSGSMLMRDPTIAWKHIMRIESSCRGVAPNHAHKIIAELEQRIPGTWVLTQNIDGFHRAAGSKQLIEMHGDVYRLRCTVCGERSTVTDYSGLSLPPRCLSCDGVIRPEVVFFGEMLPSREVQTLARELERGFDIVFSIGTTSVFPYIAEPVYRAKFTRALSVEINPSQTEVSHIVDIQLKTGAIAALTAIMQELDAATRATD